MLQPLLDTHFSEHGYGFRPGRSAHQAVLAARAHVQSGKRIVVDVDLERCFDQINRDILLDRLQKRINDARVINEAKSAIGVAFGRKFLGYSLWESGKGEVKRPVADKALAKCKQRVRQLTRRGGGRGMGQGVAKLRPCLQGCKVYFELAQEPKVWRELARLGAPTLESHSTEALQTSPDDVPGTASAGGVSQSSPTGGGQCQPVVAQQWPGA